ncbi:MAG TPA: redoxin domain-containing protein [Pyrinomonadaceae bacterium]|jgi:thiol-disulfide isomerase/thioredoxin
MTSSTPRQTPKRFWTARRLITTFVVLALLATVGLSSCTQPENVSTTNDNATVATNPATGNTAPGRSTSAPGNNAGAPPTTNGAAPPTNSGPPNTSLLTPLPAPILDAALKTIDGNKPFKLSDSKGKVLVLDLWATWCGPCRQEVPHLVELQKELGPRGVEVFGLDIDPVQDTPEDVLSFMKEFKVNYKVAFLERQYAAMLMSDNGSIPQSYVITRDGKIHSRFIGFSAASTAPRIRAAIEEALKMK